MAIITSSTTPAAISAGAFLEAGQGIAKIVNGSTELEVNLEKIKYPFPVRNGSTITVDGVNSFVSLTETSSPTATTNDVHMSSGSSTAGDTIYGGHGAGIMKGADDEVYIKFNKASFPFTTGSGITVEAVGEGSVVIYQ